MLQLEDISKSFGAQDLFSEVSWQINPGERIGLVGPNGAGKSTLCRMIAGRETLDGGRITHPSGYRIGYLPQEIGLNPDVTVLDEVLGGRQEILDLEVEMQRLTEEMGEASSDPERLQRLNKRYAEVDQKFTSGNGYALRASARSILAGMGFAVEDIRRPLGEFSGGWQMRAYLSRLLLQAPDLLLMDEPTNHLDLPSLVWLENFLRNYAGSVIIISHDRYFLNRLVTQIADMDRRRVTIYRGNYDQFIVQKEEEVERLTKAATLQQKKIDHMEDFVRRFKAKATKAKQAQSRVKALEKIERIEVHDKGRNVMNFRFPQPMRSGQDVLALENIRKAYGEHVVYEKMDFEVKRGERVGLVGPNGAGKSTLLSILAENTSFEGERLLGYNVSINHFAQHQIEALDMNATVLEEMERAATPENIGQVRGILGAFLFSGDTVKKKVCVLSGGEKNRLALAKMMLNPANLLLLDEPTNHLDIESRDVLERAMCNFEGTICFISHDRHFLTNVATRIVHVESGEARSYPGDFAYYQWKHQEELDAAAGQEGASVEADTRENSAASKKDRKRREAELRRQKAAAMGTLKKDLAKVEEEIAKHEAEKEDVEALMADPDLYNDSKKAQATIARNREIEDALEGLYEQWEEFSTRIEEVEAQFEE